MDETKKGKFQVWIEVASKQVHVFAPEQKLSFAVDASITSIFFQPLLGTDWVTHLEKATSSYPILL